jgi:hypothetical protein
MNASPSSRLQTTKLRPLSTDLTPKSTKSARSHPLRSAVRKEQEMIPEDSTTNRGKKRKELHNDTDAVDGSEQVGASTGRDRKEGAKKKKVAPGQEQKKKLPPSSPAVQAASVSHNPVAPQTANSSPMTTPILSRVATSTTTPLKIRIPPYRRPSTSPALQKVDSSQGKSHSSDKRSLTNTSAGVTKPPPSNSKLPSGINPPNSNVS